jgi:ABC-type protease/lipase transport system fused ATPase/permease subunit
VTSKESMREFGQGPVLVPVQSIDWWWGLVAVLCIVCMLALTTVLDARSQRLHAAAAVEKRVRAEMTQTVVAAYRQGRSDTLEAVGCVRGPEVRP